MSKELLLFPLPSHEVKQPCHDLPSCHTDDPGTSFDASDRLAKSGRLHTQRQAVLEALRQCDGATHAELGAFMGVHWLTPARRLPELARLGLVRKGEPRICRVKGSKCTTWWATEAAMQSDAEAR